MQRRGRPRKSGRAEGLRSDLLDPTRTFEERIAEILSPPRRLSLSAWAAENRVLGTRESGEPGRWRNERTPYLIGPMDAFSDPDVEVVVLCFCAQAGKTEVILNALGYVIDQDPGPVLIVYPSERDADKTVRNRVHPMLAASPALRRHLSGNPDDLGLKEIHTDTCTFYTAWANSAAALASTPCRYVVLDEVDKYPAFAGREANPIKLAQVRTRTYRGRRKIILVSSPTLEHGDIWQEYQRSNRQQYHVPCPHCGHYQVLDFFRGVKWRKDVPISQILEKKLAWYECERCEGEITDRQKPGMVQAGVWVPDGCAVSPEGEVVGEPPSPRTSGFHLSVLYSPWAEFAEVAVEFLDSKEDRGRLMNFKNSWLGLPWVEKLEAIDEKRLLSRRKDYEDGEVPPGAIVLTCGVDVQEDHFYFVVRAWGTKERSWLVRHGIVSSWSDLERILRTPYRTKVGTPMGVRTCFIDSGFRTEEVYRFSQKHRPLTWPTKGSNNPGLMASVKLSRPEAAVLLYNFKADYWKDKLSRLIHAGDGDSGEWSLPREVDQVYLDQMTAERRILLNQKGKLLSHWEPRTEHAPNHYWDAEVLNVLAADKEGVRYLDDNPPAPPPVPSPRRGPAGEGWLDGGEPLIGPEGYW